MTDKTSAGPSGPMDAPHRKSARQPVSAMTDNHRLSRSVHWRCFHCGETFTKAQAKHARKHFGGSISDTPACLMRIPGENELLNVVRRQQVELDAYRSQDTDFIRLIDAMSADHQVALRREEERGYAKGLRDGQVERISKS